MRTFSICPRRASEELSIPEAVAAIREVFTDAVADPDGGRNRAQQVLDRLRSLNAPAAVQEVYIAGTDEAVMVSLNDSSAKPFMLMPGEGIQFCCTETALARKLARSLGYHCSEIG
jgi:hypothetical protein